MEVLHKSRNRTPDNGDFRLMTVEEIKETVTMRDVLDKYGIKVNRSGMCCCPIHKERHPSMKVFKDGYKCFACNSGGDIFRFVQEMEGCDFKRAFLILGGTYKKYNSETARANAKVHFERLRKKEQQAKEHEKEFRMILEGSIKLCQFWIANREPFSDDWCYAQNKLPWLWSVFETKYIEGEEVNEINVFRAYREIRQRFIAV